MASPRARRSHCCFVTRPLEPRAPHDVALPGSTRCTLMSGSNRRSWRHLRSELSRCHPNVSLVRPAGSKIGASLIARASLQRSNSAGALPSQRAVRASRATASLSSLHAALARAIPHQPPPCQKKSSRTHRPNRHHGKSSTTGDKVSSGEESRL